MNKKVLGVSGTALALLMATSIFASAAEPGDFLYQYKVQVHDRIDSWFAVAYVQDIDDQVDMIEDRLAEITEKIANGEITPAQAVTLRNNLIQQIDSATRVINNNETITLNATQIKDLKDGLDRMKDVLSRYNVTLNTLDEIADTDPKEKKRNGGSKKRTYDAIVEVVKVIEDEIVEAIDELESYEIDTDNNATTTDSILDDIHSTSTEENALTHEVLTEDDMDETENLAETSADTTDTSETMDESIDDMGDTETGTGTGTASITNEIVS